MSEFMEIKTEEMLGYNEETSQWDGEPSAIWIEVFENEKRIFYSEFNNARKINIKEHKCSLYSKCFEYNGKHFDDILHLIFEETNKFNKKWKVNINKIVFDSKGKKINYLNKDNFDGDMYIYEI